MRTIIIGVPRRRPCLAAVRTRSAPVPEAEAAPRHRLQAGEYEITAKVDGLRSTDKTTPATK